MVAIKVYNEQGDEVGSVDVDLDSVASKVNRQLLHDAVVMYQANRRQGSHKSKSRAEVRGSTQKMYRQKGTGNARAGSRRSGIRRGGGHIFALRGRDYSYRLPRKALRLATRMALRARIEAGDLVVVDQLAFEEPQTKKMAGILSRLPEPGSSTLIVVSQSDSNVYRSGRNIDGVKVSPAADVNAESLLHPKRLVVTQEALKGMLNNEPAVVAEA